jgi:hypothetical protein
MTKSTSRPARATAKAKTSRAPKLGVVTGSALRPRGYLIVKSAGHDNGIISKKWIRAKVVVVDDSGREWSFFAQATRADLKLNNKASNGGNAAL